jgi:hypothetical protein
MLLNRLKDHGDGKVKLSATQVKAIEVILDRITPKLSAVEQTVVDDRDRMGEDQLLAQLSALFAAKPDLFARVVRMQQAAELVRESDSAVASAQQGDSAMHRDAQRSAASERGTARAPAPAQADGGVEPPRKNA